MAKFGKKLFGFAVLTAAAAGVYYYLKKEQEIPVNMEDDDDDFDNFEAYEEVKEDKAKRSYVNLDFQTVEAKAKEAAEKAGDFVKKSANSFESFVATAGNKVEEFFDDRKSDPNNTVSEEVASPEPASEVCEEADDSQCE